MAERGKLGVEVKQRFLSRAGEETAADQAEFTELAFTLPREGKVSASFGAESLGTTLRKVFKKEIQTGDGIFDEAVNIRTDTTDETVALLESEDIRATIESLVVKGGVLEIDGAFVKIELPGKRAADDELAMNVVRALVE
jgi:hypothetical protein